MQYQALKDVTIDGTGYKQGAVITIGHNKVDRLILLGFLAEFVEADVVNRSVGLDAATAPIKRKKK